MWLGGGPYSYRCSICGGTYSTGHFCPGPRIPQPLPAVVPPFPPAPAPPPRYGWVCPICGNVMAPGIPSCTRNHKTEGDRERDKD